MYGTEQDLEILLKQPVAIFGAGVTGRAVMEFLKGHGVDTVCYAEGCGDFLEVSSSRHRLAIVSPGFSPEHPWVAAARERGMACLGDLDFAACYWPGKILAVTGTNGKSTSVMLLAEALKAAGVDATACGNIGEPPIHLIERATRESWAVMEVSSFQAEWLQSHSCDAVIWTNFDEDHLDRHGNLTAYFQAKANLLKRRRDSTSPARVGFSVRRAAEELGLSLPSSAKVISPENSLLEGLHEGSQFRELPQAENFCLARSFWEDSGFPVHALLEAGNRLMPLPHRLQKVAESNGVAFWNDSKATNFAATRAALNRFDQPVHWIGGGYDKGGDTGRFVREIAPYVRRAFLIGDTGPELLAPFRKHSVEANYYPSLECAVTEAYKHIREPANILFSPGFSSFDHWSGYAERGECFSAFARSLTQPERLTI